MSKEYIISACSGMKIDVKQGQSITVIDIEGGQVVDFFAEADGNENEFLSAGVTIDCNESLKINVGDIIYTNLYHPMMEVMFDDVGEHDLLHPCCRPEMYDFFYHNGEGDTSKTGTDVQTGSPVRRSPETPVMRTGRSTLCSPCPETATSV